MAPRILCLHGIGTNPAIFKSQTVGFRSLLPKEWEWYFLEAEIPSVPAPGVDAVYPGPYMAWFPDPSTKSISETLEIIDDIVEDEGPFDGIMGFSQGGSVAASAILRRQLDMPFEKPQFRFAIFLCAFLPFSSNSGYGCDVTWLMLHGQDLAADYALWKKTSEYNIELSQDIVNALPSEPKEKMQSILNNNELVPRVYRFHPEHSSIRIDIPTVHVRGVLDPFLDQSVALSALADERLAQMVRHEEGHNLPKSANQDIAMAIEKVVKRADLMF